MFVGLLAVALVCGATLLAGLLTCVFFFFVGLLNSALVIVRPVVVVG